MLDAAEIFDAAYEQHMYHKATLDSRNKCRTESKRLHIRSKWNV